MCIRVRVEFKLHKFLRISTSLKEIEGRIQRLESLIIGLCPQYPDKGVKIDRGEDLEVIISK